MASSSGQQPIDKYPFGPDFINISKTFGDLSMMFARVANLPAVDEGQCILQALDRVMTRLEDLGRQQQQVVTRLDDYKRVVQQVVTRLDVSSFTGCCGDFSAHHHHYHPHHHHRVKIGGNTTHVAGRASDSIEAWCPAQDPKTFPIRPITKGICV
ncbi:hypothetical protein CDD81_6618 [Ophiocordyceps australis]|uniref:Uncharacterized protein n=1 Tax=Ophiocordyceps australis TaxID=1399860 RepID=A0A2C5Y646_9HYPO|nr:hypothetical protein CDD81_6618 [Ophiocordyceps australis]